MTTASPGAIEMATPILVISTYFGMLLVERFAPRERFTPICSWRWLGLAFLVMLFGLQGLLPELLPIHSRSR